MTKKLTEDLKKAKIKTKEMTNFNENYFVAADHGQLAVMP